jgi:hypothetical protein
VDECAAGTHNCDANAACANTIGAFTCACKPGYAGDGLAGNCIGAVAAWRLQRRFAGFLFDWHAPL